MAVRTALAWYGYGLSGESVISFIEANSENFLTYVGTNNKEL